MYMVKVVIVISEQERPAYKEDLASGATNLVTLLRLQEG